MCYLQRICCSLSREFLEDPKPQSTTNNFHNLIATRDVMRKSDSRIIEAAYERSAQVLNMGLYGTRALLPWNPIVLYGYLQHTKKYLCTHSMSGSNFTEQTIAWKPSGGVETSFPFRSLLCHWWMAISSAGLAIRLESRIHSKVNTSVPQLWLYQSWLSRFCFGRRRFSWKLTILHAKEFGKIRCYLIWLIVRMFENNKDTLVICQCELCFIPNEGCRSYLKQWFEQLDRVRFHLVVHLFKIHYVSLLFACRPISLIQKHTSTPDHNDSQRVGTILFLFSRVNRK